jgi:cell division protein FtsN
MAENRRGKDRRYFFTLAQMVLLGTAFAVTCLIVFVLGIVIGKGIEARKVIKTEEPLVKIPIKPSASGPAGATATSKEELTFYETLTKSPQSVPKPDTVREDKDGNDSAKPAKRNAGSKDSKAESGRAATPPPRKPTETRPEQTATVATAATQTADVADGKEAGKVWTVQVNAYPDERSAKQLVDRLKNKGYNALMTETRNNGKVWYRVRVGRYGSREEADKAVEELKDKEKFQSAFATSRQ